MKHKITFMDVISNYLYLIYSIFITIIILIPITFFNIIIELLGYKKIWQKSVFWLSKIILFLLMIKIEINGKKNIPNENCIITSNQLSHLDGLIIRSIINKDIFAITEPFKKFHPLFSLWMKKMNFIDVRRTKEEDKKYIKSNTRKKAIKKAVNQIKRGMSLLIFPEGHFEREKKLRKFYPGAIKISLLTGKPVLPLSIRGTEKIWPPDKLIKKPGKVIINIGKPIVFKKKENITKEKLNKKVAYLKRKIASLLPQSFR